MRSALAVLAVLILVNPALAHECVDYGPGGDPAGPAPISIGYVPLGGSAQVQDGLLFLQLLPDYGSYTTPAGAILALDPSLDWSYEYHAGGSFIGELLWDFLVVGDYVYAVDGNVNGVRPYDWRTNTRYDAVAVDKPLVAADGVLYASSGQDVAILDLATPSAPVVTGTFLDDAGVHAACVVGNKAIFLGSDHLYVVEVSSPLAPVVVGSCPYGNAPTAGLAPVLLGDVCLVGTAAGLGVYLLGDPAVPSLVGTAVTAGAVRALAATGNHAYVLAGSVETSVFQVVDFVAPAAPAVIGGFDPAIGMLFDLDILSDTVIITGRDNVLQFPLQCESAVSVLIPEITTTWRDGVCQVSWEQSDALALVRLQATCGDRTWTVDTRHSGRAFAADDATWAGDPGDEVVYVVQVSSGDSWTTVAEARTRIPAFALTMADPAPNPFNPATELSFTMGRAGVAELTVFDVAGRKVRTLESGSFGAGPHTVTWHGRDDAGQVVPAGVYFARLVTAGGVRSVKLMLVK